MNFVWRIDGWRKCAVLLTSQAGRLRYTNRSTSWKAMKAQSFTSELTLFSSVHRCRTSVLPPSKKKSGLCSIIISHLILYSAWQYFLLIIRSRELHTFWERFVCVSNVSSLLCFSISLCSLQKIERAEIGGRADTNYLSVWQRNGRLRWSVRVAVVRQLL